MKNKHTIYNIISIVFGAIALATIFLGVAQLYHSEFRTLREAEVAAKEWSELIKVGKISGINLFLGGTIDTTLYGEVTYQFSLVCFLPYLFIILGIVAAILKISVRPLNSRYMNILISLFLIIGAGLFLVQVPAAKLTSDSLAAITTKCNDIKTSLILNQGLDQYVVVRQVLKPSVFNYIGMAAAFIASISSIIPFFLEKQFDE